MDHKNGDDIVYQTILSKNSLKKIVAGNFVFSSLIQRAPDNIVSVVATKTEENRPIAFIFGIIEEKIFSKLCKGRLEKKERKNYTSNTLW